MAAAVRSSSSRAMLQVLLQGLGEPSHMWELKIGLRPALTSASEAASSGRTKPSSLSLGQWSVCRAMFTP